PALAIAPDHLPLRPLRRPEPPPSTPDPKPSPAPCPAAANRPLASRRRPAASRVNSCANSCPASPPACPAGSAARRNAVRSAGSWRRISCWMSPPNRRPNCVVDSATMWLAIWRPASAPACPAPDPARRNAVRMAGSCRATSRRMSPPNRRPNWPADSATMWLPIWRPVSVPTMRAASAEPLRSSRVKPRMDGRTSTHTAPALATASPPRDQLGTDLVMGAAPLGLLGVAALTVAGPLDRLGRRGVGPVGAGGQRVQEPCGVGDLGGQVVAAGPVVAALPRRRRAVGRQVLDQDAQLPQGDLAAEERGQGIAGPDPGVVPDQVRFDGFWVVSEDVEDVVGTGLPPLRSTSRISCCRSTSTRFRSLSSPPCLRKSSYWSPSAATARSWSLSAASKRSFQSSGANSGCGTVTVWPSASSISTSSPPTASVYFWRTCCMTTRRRLGLDTMVLLG